MLNIWVGNLGKYNEGELKGGWLELPKEKEEIDEFLKEVVGLNDEYEEYMINDFETDLPYKVNEYESIKMLNLLAKVSENIYNMEAIEGYANSEGDLSIEELMNIIIQEDEIPYYSYQIDSWTMSAEEKYGYRFAEDTGLLDVLQQHEIEGYFDFESYGRDAEMSGYVELLDDGYIDKSESIDLNKYSLQEIIEMYDIEEETEKKLKVIYKQVGKDPIVMEIDDILEAKQKLVGGLIEVVPYKEDLLLVCNEEGKILNQKPNLDFGYDYIAGNCFVVGDDFENAGFKSVREEQIEEIKQDLKDRSIEVVEIEEVEEDDMEF